MINYSFDCLHIKSQAVMEDVLQLLGWTVSLDPKERAPACRRFEVSGVVVDLTKVEQGAVVVSNKPERGTQEREGGGWTSQWDLSSCSS